MKIRKVVGVVLAVALAGVGVWAALRPPQPAGTTPNRLAVYASFYPLYDTVKQVGGDKVTVTNMTPAGSEPHDFDPSPQLLAQATAGKVFVYSGVAFEPWTQKFLTDYRGLMVNGSTGMSLREGDPHYWLDPVLMQQLADNVAAGLAKADPANATYYQQQATKYKATLAELDARFGMGLVRCQSNTFVTAHAAFGYLAARYDLTQVAISGISPDAEASPEKLAELARLVKEQNITTVFFETLTSPKLAQTLATETGAKTAVLDPVEGVSASREKSGTDYLSIQGENLASLRRALACR